MISTNICQWSHYPIKIGNISLSWKSSVMPLLQSEKSQVSSQAHIVLIKFTSIWFSFAFSQFSSVTQSCPTLCDPMDCNTPGFPVHHQLLEHAQAHVHWVGDAIQPSHPLLSPSSAFNLSQHQGIFQGFSSSHQVAKVLELQLQHQSFQWVFRTDFL